jgi:hypothetical protein
MNKNIRRQLMIATSLQLVDARKAQTPMGRWQSLSHGRHAASELFAKASERPKTTHVPIRHIGLNE